MHIEDYEFGLDDIQMFATILLEDRSKPVLVTRENFMNAEFSTFLHRQICKIEVLNDALPSPAEDYNAVHTFHTMFNMPDGYIV